MSVIFPSTLVTLTCTGPNPDSIEFPVLVTAEPDALFEFCEADGAGLVLFVGVADADDDAAGCGAVLIDSLP